MRIAVGGDDYLVHPARERTYEVIPVLLYGSEFWTLNKNLLRRLKAAEMKVLRSVAG